MQKTLVSPQNLWELLKNKIKTEWKVAFFTVFIVGLCVHFPVISKDIPNHDGLASMYFDQNMITSGRWFLMVACGISSYFTLPWVIGLLSLIFLGIGAAALVEFLELRDKLGVMVVSALLVVFPSLASTYTYIFTADGYMMGLMLAMFAVMFVEKGRFGFIAGGICLAFSMGIYQSYLPFAIILSIYGCIRIMLNADKKAKLLQILRYLYMGLIGVGGYYLILQVLLNIQGKELDTYQGINGMALSSGVPLSGMMANLYHDFIAFTGKGNVLYNNMLSFIALIAVAAVFLVVFVQVVVKCGYVKRWYFYLICLAVIVVLPIVTNVILMISPSVTYHLLMRYQWVLYPILFFAFIWKETDGTTKTGVTLQWIALMAASILVLHFAVTDNIAYSNLEKKYEKTYAYCLRMVDRMEQTEGYYTGMPVAMIGVQNKETLPETDITGDVTSGMIGMTGDYLIYTDTNYQEFMKNYLGVTMNLVSDEEMERIYYTDEYQALNSFPETGSMKVVDGILYIKTE